jgi:hypothetical protein
MTEMIFRTPAQQFIYFGTLFVVLQTNERIYEELFGLLDEINVTTMTNEETIEMVKSRLDRLTKGYDQMKQLRPFFENIERSFEADVRNQSLRQEQDMERITRRFGEFVTQQLQVAATMDHPIITPPSQES